MKIDSQFIINNIKGQPMLSADRTSELKAGEVLGNILFSSDRGGKMKCYVLGQKFATADGIVEVDASDFSLIVASVETNKLYNNLVSGRVLEYLETTKDEKKSTK